MEPQRFAKEQIILEGDSNADGHYDAVGDAYLAHRDAGAPLHVAGRADTEADRGVDIVPPRIDTRVYVWIWLFEKVEGVWVLRASDSAWADHPCNTPGQTLDYDVDVVVRAPLNLDGSYWRTYTYHRVYRDGVRTGSGGQWTPQRWLHWLSPPLVYPRATL